MPPFKAMGMQPSEDECVGHDAISAGIRVFNRHATEYDEWFERNRHAYESELRALRSVLPRRFKGLEVGVGTGRFAIPLGFRVGLEPAEGMAAIARKRGVDVAPGVAEALPYPDEAFDVVLMVTTVCFLESPPLAFSEAGRVLRRKGKCVVGMMDWKSRCATEHGLTPERGKFHRHATFHSVEEIVQLLHGLDFDILHTRQTLFHDPETIITEDPVRDGYGDGLFVVISAQSKRSP